MTVFRYVTSGSSDAYRYQTVERKALASDQLLSGDVSSRSIDDIGGIQADYATTKAIASGDHIVKSRVRLQLNIQELQSLARVHQKQQLEARESMNKAQGRLVFLKENEPDNTQAIANLNAQIQECRDTLSQPFERQGELSQLQTKLAELDHSIQEMNRSRPKRKGNVAHRLLGSVFGRGGQS